MRRSMGKHPRTKKQVTGNAGTGRKTTDGPALPEYARDAMLDFLQKVHDRDEAKGKKVG